MFVGEILVTVVWFSSILESLILLATSTF